MSNILVLGCGGPAVHNFIDAVNQIEHDYTFVGADASPYMLALSSLEKKYLIPKANDYGYLEAVQNIINREKIDFIHIQSDAEVKVITGAFGKFGEVKTLLPMSSTVNICQDKKTCFNALYDHGISVPDSYPADDETISALLRIHGKIWMRAKRGAGSRAALPITSLLQAQGWKDYWKQKCVREEDFMVSEYLPGKEYAWQSLWYNGELISSQARERVEYFAGNLAPSGQTSSPSVARTVTQDTLDETGKAAVRAVAKVPHGVFCIDMKENDRHIPCVTEINAGRFFTTSNFFAHAGLNMPAMYLELGLTGGLEDRPGRTDNLPDNLYWLRWIDCNFKLVDGKDIDTNK